MAKRKISVFKVAFVVTLLFLLMTIYGTVNSIININRFLAKTEQAEGLVVGYKPKRKVAMPIIDFVDNKGKRQQCISRMGHQGAPEFPLGAKVKIRYDPNRPVDSAVIDDHWQIWGSTYMVLILGSLPFLILVGLWLILRNPKPKDVSQAST